MRTSHHPLLGCKGPGSFICALLLRCSFWALLSCSVDPVLLLQWDRALHLQQARNAHRAQRASAPPILGGYVLSVIPVTPYFIFEKSHWTSWGPLNEFLALRIDPIWYSEMNIGGGMLNFNLRVVRSARALMWQVQLFLVFFLSLLDNDLE